MRVVAVALRVVLPAASRRRRRRRRPERLLLVTIPCKHHAHLVALDGPAKSWVNSNAHHETAIGPDSAAPSPLHASCDCCRFGCPRLSGGRHQSTSNGRTPEPGSSHSPPWSSLETPLSPPAKPKKAFSETDVEKRSGSAFRSHCGRRARATGGRRSTRRVSPGGPVPRQRSTRPRGLRFPASGACLK